MFEWAYSGVDHSLAGNGGQDCMEFIGPTRRVLETTTFITIGIIEMFFAYPNLHLPESVPKVTRLADRSTRRVLLLLHCTVFGIELGFKFATHQMIWILNPCHVVTMLQIYLLVAPPSKTLMATFRIHIYCLNGATLAFLFPVINTRLLPFEAATYYIQHILMLVVPYFLMREGGVYTPEPLKNFWWCFMAMGILMMYHWIFLQGLALLSMVNLNHMMCPAVSDPFYGPWYRVSAAIHQSAFVTLHAKFYTWISLKYLPKSLPGEKESTETIEHTNGHAKEL